jgi:PAS domain S-box-containing protein
MSSTHDPASTAMREFADALDQIVWAADSRGHNTFVNGAWIAFTGLTSELSRGTGWQLGVHPGDADRFMARWLEATPGGMPFQVQARLRSADGLYRLFNCAVMPYRDSTGELREWIGICHDAEVMQRADERLRVIADTLPLLVWTTDRDDRLTFVNRAWIDYTGLLAGTTIEERNELVHPDDLVSLMRALRSGHPEVEVRLRRRRDQMYRWHLFRWERLWTGDEGTQFARIGIAIDIHESRIEREREHRVADVLQKASLPRRLPEVAGIAMDATYRPAQGDATIGGDWYDAFVLIDGRIVVSIGDVAGSGLDAAVTMSNMRQVIRGIAQVHADPRLMLHAADRALRVEDSSQFVTAFVGVLDPVIGSFKYASAGHVPPLVRRVNGSVEELIFNDLPLGVRESDALPTTAVDVREGDMLVFYTDGLVESSRDLGAGIARLCEIVRERSVLSSPRPAAMIVARMLPDGAHDDIAVLTLKVTSSALRAESIVEWAFRAIDGNDLSRLREEFRAAVLARDPDQARAKTAELVLGELVGNAIRHAPGPIRVAVDFSNKRAVLHVIDEGPGFERAPMLPLDPLSESGRGLFIVAQLTREFSVTRRHPRGSHARALLHTG